MSTALEKPQFTPEDLLRMPDGKNYELVDGQLVECDRSFQSGWVASLLVGRLATFAVHLTEARAAISGGISSGMAPATNRLLEGDQIESC